MLTPLCQHDDNTRLLFMLSDKVALDLEHGAYLTPTYGRGRAGLRKYVLIVKGKQDSLDALVHGFDWQYRSFVRAWNDDEAISIANKRMDKWMSGRK